MARIRCWIGIGAVLFGLLLGGVAGSAPFAQPAFAQPAAPLPAAPLPAAPLPAAGTALFVTLAGPIGPARADYLHGALAVAQERGAGVVVIRLDTPGGLMTSMDAIVRDILDAPMPVVCVVAPEGARAASAGTFILYACPIAAMMPSPRFAASPNCATGTGNGRSRPSGTRPRSPPRKPWPTMSLS